MTADDYAILLGADTARISQPCSRMYLIIGERRNTRGDPGQWMRNGKPVDFDYVAERVVASGDTAEELEAAAREFKRISQLSLAEYLIEQGWPAEASMQKRKAGYEQAQPRSGDHVLQN